MFNDYVTDPKKISNLLNYRFSILGKISGSEKTLPKQKRYTWKTFSFRVVTKKECVDAIKSLSKNKPLGPSLISAWSLKNSSPIITHDLSYIVNSCIQESYFPKRLKKARIKPLFKKGELDERNIYRPISFTHCLSKVIITLMRNQINDYLNVNRLSSKHQYGFKKKRSTIDAIMYATEFIRKETDKNKFVTAAFLDLSKAFDSINHEILSIKLGNLGFDASALKLIGSFLSDRVQSVVFNDIFQTA